MALELNKKKYLVVLVMLILLNYHITGAKGAESQGGAQKGSKAAEPLTHGTGSKATSAASPAAPALPSQIPNVGDAGLLNNSSQIPGNLSSLLNNGSLGSLLQNGSQIPNGGNLSALLKNENISSLLNNGSQIPNAGNLVTLLNNGSQNPNVAALVGNLFKPQNPDSLQNTETPNPAVAKIVDALMANKTKPTGPYKMIKIPGAKPGPPQVPCYFIFGDSLVDAGNNNILKTLARADYAPYGLDFAPQPGPTGRFSNGKTTVDVITELLGFDHYMPPSELTNGTDMLQGLNFASAAAGIREETAQHLGDKQTLREQVESFKSKIKEMEPLLGGPKNTTDYLGKCLFQLGFGSNDYLNNYFIPNIYPTSRLLTPEQYADDLIKQYTTHLTTIYNLGARKIALSGVSQVGCSPNSMAQNSQDGTCVKKFNDANEIYNKRLIALVDTLNKDHPDAKFTYINAFGLFQDLKDKAATYGLKDTTDGCCGVGKNHGLFTCLPGIAACPNRNEYLFWDAYHPTEVTNIIGGKRSYTKEKPDDVHPYDIQTLIKL